MEELNIEQKAKRYDEILARAKDANMPHYMKEFVDYLIPELKETEDERLRKCLKRLINGLTEEHFLRCGASVNEIHAWLEKQCEQKPTEWSGEDKNMIENIFETIDAYYYLFPNYEEKLSWLKSLKERVQPKQVWSEEDEQMINDIIEAIDKQYAVSDYQEMVTWLKSIKYRYSWKPSDEQMEALDDVISARDFKYVILFELWKNLKKLKED